MNVCVRCGKRDGRTYLCDDGIPHEWRQVVVEAEVIACELCGRIEQHQLSECILNAEIIGD